MKSVETYSKISCTTSSGKADIVVGTFAADLDALDKETVLDFFESKRDLYFWYFLEIALAGLLMLLAVSVWAASPVSSVALPALRLRPEVYGSEGHVYEFNGEGERCLGLAGGLAGGLWPARVEAFAVLAAAAVAVGEECMEAGASLPREDLEYFA